jgi:hypothetical protein
LDVGYDIVHDTGYIQAQHVGLNPTPLLINPTGGPQSYVGVGAAQYTISGAHNTSLIAFGSGNTDTFADTFKVAQANVANPYEICMGSNITGGYGVIQAQQNGIGQTDLRLNPLGANAVAVNGIKLPTADGSGSFTILGSYEQFPTQSWTLSGANGAVVLNGIQYIKIGKQVFITTPASQTAGGITTGSITVAAIPLRFRPNIQIYAPNCYGQSGGANVALAVLCNTDGTIVINPASGNSFAGSGNQGFYGLSITYSTTN